MRLVSGAVFEVLFGLQSRHFQWSKKMAKMSSILQLHKSRVIPDPKTRVNHPQPSCLVPLFTKMTLKKLFSRNYFWFIAVADFALKNTAPSPTKGYHCGVHGLIHQQSTHIHQGAPERRVEIDSWVLVQRHVVNALGACPSATDPLELTKHWYPGPAELHIALKYYS